MIDIGKKIGKFSLPDQSTEKKQFADLAGEKGLVLYVYPKDNTPGCTTEANDFQAHLKDFKKLGYSVVGISKDSVKSHNNFTDKYKLKFPLLSDPDVKLLEKLGAWGEKKNYGKTYMGIIRSTFIFDSKGKLLKDFRNVRAKGHVDRLLRELSNL